MNNRAISMVCYADDAAVFAESENDVKRQLFKFYQMSQKLNMDISIGKTKTMTIAREPMRCKLVIDNKPIEQVMQFRYQK